MKKKMRFPESNNRRPSSSHEKGMALVIVILVLAFLQVVGIVLLTVTGTGPRVAGNIRAQQQAYNGADAGFDTTWTMIEEAFASGNWIRFDGHYLTEPVGIDDPTSADYFRKLTDRELLDLIDPNEDGIADINSVLYCRQLYVRNYDGSFDPRYTFTAFIIDDEAGSAVPDPADCILVCIGTVDSGASMTTSRIEIELAIQLPGT
ncbi:MAG: pilus assembly PilX N-terminal domain-containing protein [Candidatus Aminicenantes bacterium]